MTRKEISRLVKYLPESKTYYARYGGYGFNGSSHNVVVERITSMICQAPGCDNKRFDTGDYISFLCRSHYR